MTLAAALMLAAGWGGAAAAPELGPREAWTFALDHSLMARQAQSVRNAGRREAEDAERGLIPRLGLFGGYDSNNYVAGGEGWTASVHVQPAGNDLERQVFRRSIRRQMASRAEWQADATLDELRFRILSGYCQYHFFAQRAQIQAQLVASFGGLEQVLGPDEAALAEDGAVLGDLAEDLEVLEEAAEESRLAPERVLWGLRDAIGWPPTAELRVSGNVEELIGRLSQPLPVAPDFSRNAELRALEEESGLAAKEALFRRILRFPQPELRFDLTQGRDASHFWYEPRADVGFRWQVVAGLRWNLLDWGAARREEDAAAQNAAVVSLKSEQLRGSLWARWQQLVDQSALVAGRQRRIEVWIRRLEFVLATHGAGEPGQLESIKDFVRLHRRILDLRVRFIDSARERALIGLEAWRMTGLLAAELPLAADGPASGTDESDPLRRNR